MKSSLGAAAGDGAKDTVQETYSLHFLFSLTF